MLNKVPVLENGLRIFTGNAHPALAQAVCDYLEIPMGRAEVFKFANDNTFVRILENVRQRDVFIVQPTGAPTNDNLMELLIMIDACKRASAGRITAVVPYYGYSRTDKKDQPRVPITARLVADLLTAAGADRLLTVDLHAGQIQGFFNIPVDELTALPLLSEYFKAKELEDLVVVAVDVGISKRARDVAEQLNAPLAIIEKRRVDNDDRSETLNVIGEVRGKVALTFDDEILTGGTTVNAGNALLESGVTRAGLGDHQAVHGGKGEAGLEGRHEGIGDAAQTDDTPATGERKRGCLVRQAARLVAQRRGVEGRHPERIVRAAGDGAHARLGARPYQAFVRAVDQHQPDAGVRSRAEAVGARRCDLHGRPPPGRAKRRRLIA